MNVACSVCIANHNGIYLIDECIASLRAQSCNFPFEIIVHDDASTDGSVQHIRTSHPEVRLIESQENVGFCVANNRMAAAAQGEYLLLLNNDATLFPDALAVLMQETTQIGHALILSLPQYDADTGDLLDIGSLTDPFLNPVPNIDPNRHDVSMVMGACMWIPKTLWNTMGGFPEWFGSIGEDLYFCCRARLAGYPVRALSMSGYRHRVGESFGGGKVRHGRLVTNSKRRALSERNKTFVMLICYPWQLLLLLFPLHLLVLHLEGLLIALLKWHGALWREIYAPLLPALWQKRRQLVQTRREAQKLRKCRLGDFLSPFRLMPRKLEMLLKYGMPDVDVGK